jgi:hypothetical protein
MGELVAEKLATKEIELVKWGRGYTMGVKIRAADRASNVEVGLSLGIDESMADRVGVDSNRVELGSSVETCGAV